jgi:hypothetical protein
MKKFSLIGFVVLLISTAILFSGCEKEGPAGKDGVNGINGVNGNANVKSYFYSVTTSQWVEYGTAGQEGHHFYYNLSVPSITANIFDYGSVLVYINDDASLSEKSLLPYAEPFDGYESVITCDYSVGIVKLVVYCTDLISEIPSGTAYLDVVIIEGTAGN